MSDSPKKKYTRTVPTGRKRVVEIPAHGMYLQHVISLLQGCAEMGGVPRCYVGSDGRLIVAIQSYNA